MTTTRLYLDEIDLHGLLARALLLAGMQLLKERGMETAVLGTSSQNIAIQKTPPSK